MNLPYYVLEPTGDPVPIVISIPHCGTDFPADLKEDYIPEQLADLDDTDWFLERLNEYAPALGITVIHAKYHRWVIDLNRDPESVPLYNDGRVITGLCSTTDFLGNSIYKPGKEPSEEEIERRLSKFYWPYYRAVEDVLQERLQEFGEVLLWDEHSIRSLVPSIRPEKFPEMILGNNDEQSSKAALIQTTLKNLRTTYQVNHNDPFKGGHITRYFGNPEKGVHALQLERNKNLYMDDSEKEYHPERAAKMQEILKNNFLELAGLIGEKD